MHFRIARISLTIALVIGAAACSTDRTSSSGSGQPAKPNIVMLYMDDLDRQLLDENIDLLPNYAALVAHGATFTNTFVADSLCCPSRATMLRGQYDHNTGMRGNAPPHGGFEYFHAADHESSTIATWLDDAGYTTALFGKYLNGYPHTVDRTYVPPGWDEWLSPSSGKPYSEYDYTLNVNGKLERHGHDAGDYLVDVISEHAVDFIDDHAGSGPIFAVIAPYVPHLPADPAPRYADTQQDLETPRGPSFNEPDVSDKPRFISRMPALTAQQIDVLDIVYRRQVRAMRAADDLIGAVVDALRDRDELDETYIVFTSDNGFHRGAHRLQAGKLTAYEEDIKVPLVVQGPGVEAHSEVHEMTLNTDLGPTFADLAGVQAPKFVDGRSFAPLLDPHRSPRDWRASILVERSDDDINPALRAPASAPGAEPAAQVAAPATTSTTIAAPLPADPDEPEMIPNDGEIPDTAIIALVPAYAAVRTSNYLYVEWASGDRELYDLRVDPYELVNLVASAPPEFVAAMHDRLAELRGCAAATCRTVEDRPEPTPPTR